VENGKNQVSRKKKETQKNRKKIAHRAKTQERARAKQRLHREEYCFHHCFRPCRQRKTQKTSRGEKRKRNWGEKGELKKNKTEERRQWQCWWDSPSTLSSSSATASSRNQSVSFFLSLRTEAERRTGK